MRLIYDYESFRKYLKDYYLWQKSRNPSFSYPLFAKQLGLSSAAQIQHILSGKRNLTVHNIHRVAEALTLPRGETEYFETLVHANQAETKAEREFYELRLGRLHALKPRSSARLRASYLLTSGVLPAMLLSIDGKTLEAAKSAGAPFGYKPEETGQILEQLLKEGVIELAKEGDRAGTIRLSQRHLILHDHRARSQAQKAFLRKQLHFSTRAFETMYEKNGKFYAHTFTVNPERLARYIDEIKALIEKTTAISDEEPGESVMQLNVQFFPYTKELR